MAVRLAELLENRQDRQQAASALTRVRRSVSVGIAGLVGAGKICPAISLAIAFERLVPYWSEKVTYMFDYLRLRKERKRA